jgi:hypothetical protein
MKSVTIELQNGVVITFTPDRVIYTTMDNKFTLTLKDFAQIMEDVSGTTKQALADSGGK